MKHFYALVLSVFLALMIAVPSISLIPRDNGGGGGLSITDVYKRQVFRHL